MLIFEPIVRQNTTIVELHGRQYLTLCWIRSMERPLTGPLPVTPLLILCHLPKQHHQLGAKYLTHRSVWHIIIKKLQIQVRTAMSYNLLMREVVW